MEEKTQQEPHFGQYADDLYTRAEAEKILHSIRNRQGQEELELAMQQVWEESIALTRHPDTVDSVDRQEAQAILRKDRTVYIRIPRRGLKKALSVAASILILIAIGFSGFQYFTRSGETSLTEVAALYGETREVILPDGTTVVLNACSQITYPSSFRGEFRQIELSGEAYFHVTPNKKQGFVVRTGQFDVKVLGTEFNVKAYKGDEIQSVQVENGKVQIDMPESMFRLSGQEQIEINTQTGSYTKEKASYDDISVWRMGQLRFIKTPVRDVVKQLERLYHCRISWKSDLPLDNLISGEHDNESLEEVLESIRLTTGIRWKTGNNTKEIILYY